MKDSRKYVLDTQLYIQAFRDPAANEALQEFHRVFAPFEYFSAVVAQELRAGVRRPQDRKSLEKHVVQVFARANRMIAPTAGAWHRSGDVLAQMAVKDGLEIARVSKRLPTMFCWHCHAARPGASSSPTIGGTSNALVASCRSSSSNHGPIDGLLDMRCPSAEREHLRSSYSSTPSPFVPAAERCRLFARKMRSQRTSVASEPRARSGDHGVPASERGGGSGGAKPRGKT